MKSIFRPGSAPDPGGLAYDAPQSRMVRGHPCQVSFDAFGVSISIEVVIGPHENGFRGPAAAVDGPA